MGVLITGGGCCPLSLCSLKKLKTSSSCSDSGSNAASARGAWDSTGLVGVEIVLAGFAGDTGTAASGFTFGGRPRFLGERGCSVAVVNVLSSLTALVEDASFETSSSAASVRKSGTVPGASLFTVPLVLGAVRGAISTTTMDLRRGRSSNSRVDVLDSESSL